MIWTTRGPWTHHSCKVSLGSPGELILRYSEWQLLSILSRARPLTQSPHPNHPLYGGAQDGLFGVACGALFAVALAHS